MSDSTDTLILTVKTFTCIWEQDEGDDIEVYGRLFGKVVGERWTRLWKKKEANAVVVPRRGTIEIGTSTSIPIPDGATEIRVGGLLYEDDTGEDPDDKMKANRKTVAIADLPQEITIRFRGGYQAMDVVYGAEVQRAPDHHGHSTPFDGKSLHQQHVLLGHKVTVEDDSTVTGLAVFMHHEGPEVKLGLYTDTGSPGALVAATEAAATVEGHNVLPVEPVAIKAGDYWLMTVFSGLASVGHDPNADPMVAWEWQDFSKPLPATLSGSHQSYDGEHFNVYVVSQK